MLSRFSIRLAVALVTFVVGLKLAWFAAALFGPALSGAEVQGLHAAPPVVKTRSCPTSLRGLDLPPPPPPPAASEPSTSQQTRVVIRRSDGTVKVVETRTETKAPGK